MLSMIRESSLFVRVASLSHDDMSLLIAIVNGVFGIWSLKLSLRNKKDIDGVAEVAGTERAKDRCQKKNKGCDKC